MNHLVEIIEHNLQDGVYKNIYYLKNSEEVETTTYLELIKTAKQLAAYFVEHYPPQSRIVLMFPQGTSFLSALLGCFYAGMIAVPTYPLQNAKHAYRLYIIIKSSKPSLILGTNKTIDEVSTIPELGQFNFASIEGLLSDNCTIDFDLISKHVSTKHLAFLQYTSGSTGNPKGVMVSHQNLIHNLSTLKIGLNFEKDRTTVIWLPFQHDLGLIGGALSSLYNGNELVVIPPIAVIQNPYVWLKAISDYQAYFTAGPNFAYQLCIDKIADSLLSTLDLSSVGYALTAAEPNRPSTASSFCNKFAVCGFKKEAYSVGYGLAENTLHVTANLPGTISFQKKISTLSLGQGAIQEPINEKDSQVLMSGGTLYPEHKVVIVNPENHKRCMPHEIGEIWVQSYSTAEGYWGNKEATDITFKAVIEGEEGKYYLRTGDLGFIDGNQLYMTGRLKDLIIINGRNIYPQDIELVVEQCHSDIKNNCVVAFSLEKMDKESIIICAEISRSAVKKDSTKLLACIRHAVAVNFEVEIADIKLIYPSHSFRTTSGKIQRKATKEAYLDNSLVCIDNSVNYTKLPAKKFKDEDKLKTILCDVLRVNSIEEEQHFMDLGGTSMHAKMLQQQLELYFGDKYQIPASIAYDCPTLLQLIAFFSEVEKSRVT